MRLNELEESGLITHVIIQKRPKLVRWTLTEKGEDALPILEGYFSFTKKWHPNATLKNHRSDSLKRPSLLELVEQLKQVIVS
jgi:DNA-binding HxlR family transcriptional regulator